MPKKGYVRTKEHQEKLNEAVRRYYKENPMSEERRAQISEYKKANPVRYWLGRERTEEHKRKLGLAHKGTKLSEEHKRKIGEASKRLGLKPPSWKGRKHTEETLSKMRIAQRGPRPSQRGENSNHWKGGLTPTNMLIRHSLEIRGWREAVFVRDDFTCQKYGVRGGILHAHHLKNFSQYPELRFAIDNGITLSDKAHIEFHKKYGKQNNTPEQMQEFLCQS